jgi:site-specific recombinase
MTEPEATQYGEVEVAPQRKADDKIADFGASISRTQLAAALGNVLAVCAGAIIFDLFWRSVFHSSYLPAH